MWSDARQWRYFFIEEIWSYFADEDEAKKLWREKGSLLRIKNNQSERDIEERWAKVNLRTAGNYVRPFRAISAAIKLELRQFIKR